MDERELRARGEEVEGGGGRRRGGTGGGRGDSERVEEDARHEREKTAFEQKMAAAQRAAKTVDLDSAYKVEVAQEGSTR